MSQVLRATKPAIPHPRSVVTVPDAATQADVSTNTTPAGTAYENTLLHGADTPRLARQIRRLADHIVSEFPKEKGATILLTSMQSCSDVADVAGLISRQLIEYSRSDVLLIDADSERKVLSQRFAATTDPAMVAVLQDGLAARSAIVSSIIPQLKLLPFGPGVLTRRTLTGESVQAMLVELRRDYRYIIVAADVCNGPLTETLARQSDGTYVVVPLGRTERHQSVRMLHRLVATGARLLGTVVTGVE